MWISKTAHKAVCEQYDKRILELKDQIAYLRSLSIPLNNPIENFTDAFEDKTITEPPTAEIIDPEIKGYEQAQQEELAVVLRERDNLLSGNYANEPSE